MSPYAAHFVGFLRRRAGSAGTWFVLLLVFLGCYRFSLIGKGHFFWGDECCFLPASRFVDSVSRGEYRSAAADLFDVRRSVPAARPGFVLVSVLPVLAQRAIGPLAGIQPGTLRYYDIASAFNVLVTLGVTVCMFTLGSAWTARPWFGLLIALLYSFLSNANVWVRHMVPYPESLLLFLVALWLLSTAKGSDSKQHGMVRAALAGLLTALAYACYPGHYSIFAISAVVAAARPGRRVLRVAVFGLSCAVVIGFFEVLARWAGRSYLQDLRTLSTSITMGDPREGFVFAWHYLKDVDGAVGVALFALFMGFVTFLLRRRRAGINPAARAAIIAALGCYLFHASMGVLFGRMVFYGRVLMVYLPFVVTGAVLALMNVSRPALRRAGVFCLTAASVYSFALFAFQYDRLVYPADFLQQTMTRLGRNVTYPAHALWAFSDGELGVTVEEADPDLVTVVDPRPGGSEVFVLLASHQEAIERKPRFIGVNLKFMWYVRERYDRFIPPKGYRLVAEALHPEVFPATGYEGRKPWERKRIRQRQYKMQIYERMYDEARLTSLSGTRSD